MRNMPCDSNARHPLKGAPTGDHASAHVALTWLNRD